METSSLPTPRKGAAEDEVDICKVYRKIKGYMIRRAGGGTAGGGG